MSDLVTKLREPIRTFTGKMRDYPDGRTEGPFHPLMLEAADRIEALQELVAAAEEAEWLTKDIFWSIWDDYRLLGGTIKVDTPDMAINWKATAAALEKENAELRAERDLLQDILDGRPAINAGLPETYIRWSQSVYSGDAVRAIFSRIKPTEAEGREG